MSAEKKTPEADHYMVAGLLVLKGSVDYKRRADNAEQSCKYFDSNYRAGCIIAMRCMYTAFSEACVAVEQNSQELALYGDAYWNQGKSILRIAHKVRSIWEQIRLAPAGSFGRGYIASINKLHDFVELKFPITEPDESEVAEVCAVAHPDKTRGDVYKQYDDAHSYCAGQLRSMKDQHKKLFGWRSLEQQEEQEDQMRHYTVMAESIKELALARADACIAIGALLESFRIEQYEEFKILLESGL